ncbi:MAG: DUF1329 domain-containing protein, partial [Desulfobacterales bacterium]|nr:DUF1329 domain-containing protein [Desulfobacterales bacterium]
AEKAGNADGTIPPYTGGIGLDKVPPGFDRKTMLLPNPYADEKPLYSIDAKNMDQYSDKLTEGSKALFAQYPDYRMDVYPTHRTVAISDRVAEHTRKSAANAILENDGKKLTGAANGFPFPMPKNGLEAIWNHLLRWSSPGDGVNHYQSFVVTAAGRRIMTSEGNDYLDYPYWGDDNQNKGFLCRINDTLVGPANRNGEKLIWFLKTDKTNGDPAWQYLPGQRRVKMAPEISYDGPNTTVAGASTYDDAFVYSGSPDRYEWKILGKKEIFVPYNNYKLLYHSTPEEAITPKHLNPDTTRWELHRVWVVEATLKSGMRHIYVRRTVFIDEDSWIALSADCFDNKNQIYRCAFSGMVFNPDLMAPYSLTYWGYDLIGSIYYVNVFLIGPNLEPVLFPESYWNPQMLAGSGLR